SIPAGFTLCWPRDYGILSRGWIRMLVSAQMSTREVLEELLSQRILLLDGSMGALIYSHQPSEEDYRGQRFRNHPVALQNCTEALVLAQPRMIEGIHRAYLEAGADIIE